MKEENCTIDDIGAYMDNINMQHLKKNMSYDDCRQQGDFIVNVILSNEGKAMYFDGYNLLLSTLEIEKRVRISKEDKNKLIPNVEIFKEIMVELIKNKEIDIEMLKKERQEYIQEKQPEFQLNEMALHLTDEYPECATILKIETYRAANGNMVRFENVLNEKGEIKSISCSNVIILVEWILDKGAGYVLTGMMVRRNQNVTEENGDNLEVVTIISEYREPCLLDIHNLPVVEKGKRKFC